MRIITVDSTTIYHLSAVEERCLLRLASSPWQDSITEGSKKRSKVIESKLWKSRPTAWVRDCPHWFTDIEKALIKTNPRRRNIVRLTTLGEIVLGALKNSPL